MSKQNKFFATAATAALVASAIVPVASAAEFSDADKVASWATEAVEALSTQGVIAGNPDGSFNPTGNVTRAEAAKMFTVALDLSTEGTENFTDVNGEWFAEYVVAAVNANIVNGMSATTFAPKANLTREQAAKMIVEAYGLTGEADLSTFADAKTVEGKWSESYLSTAVATGVIKGQGEKLAATNSITRQEFAVMLTRAMDATTDNAAELLADVEKAATALDTAVKALNTEVKADEIAAATAEVATAKEAIVNLEAALEAAKEVVTEEQATATKEAIATANKAIKATEAVIAKAVEDAKVLAVDSVTAINGTTLEVKFTKPVNASSIYDASTGVINSAALTVTKTAQAASITASNLIGKLSEDGKTLTITVKGGTEFFKGAYTLEVIKDKIVSKDKATEFVTAYQALVNADDTVAPAIEGVTYEATTATVTFTENLASVGSVSLNGSQLSVSDYTFVAGTNKLEILNLEAGKSYTLTIVGAKDVAGNLTNPNALTTTVNVPVDSVKPTVQTTVEGTKVTFQFSEVLKALDLDADSTATEFAKVTVGSTVVYLDASNQDSKDKSKFVVDFATVLGTSAFLNTNAVIEGFQDLSANVGEKQTLAVSLVKDTTAPKFVSATTKNDLVIVKFDEAVEPASLAEADIKVKFVDADGILHPELALASIGSVEGKYDANGNGVIDGDEENYISIKVTDTNYLSATNFKSGNYTYTIAAGKVTDGFNPTTTATTFSVKVDAAATNEIVKLTGAVQDATALNVIKATFDKDMSTTALNAGNYTLGNTELPTGTELTFVGDKKNVQITLPVGYVFANGSQQLKVKDLTDVDGNKLNSESVTAMVVLKENVLPVASKLNLVDSQNLTVEFSEKLKALSSTVAGVTVKVNNVKVVLDASSPFAVNDNVLTIKALAADAFKLTDVITVEFADSNIQDTVGNAVKNVTISK